MMQPTNSVLCDPLFSMLTPIVHTRICLSNFWSEAKTLPQS